MYRVCPQIDDYSMVRFLPFDRTDEEGINIVLQHIDFSIQYGEDLEFKEPKVTRLSAACNALDCDSAPVWWALRGRTLYGKSETISWNKEQILRVSCHRIPMLLLQESEEDPVTNTNYDEFFQDKVEDW